MVCKRDGGSPTVRFHLYLLLKLSLMFVILRLDSFPLLVSPNSLPHIIRLFQRAPLGEKKPGLEFPVCKMKVFLCCPLLSKECYEVKGM